MFQQVSISGYLMLSSLPMPLTFRTGSTAHKAYMERGTQWKLIAILEELEPLELQEKQLD